MKKIKRYFLLLNTIIFTLIACSAEEKKSVKEESQSKESELSANQKILIVYLSRTKNTKALAEIIHKKVGGDLVALELVTPYPDHYRTTVNQVSDENAKGYLPALKTTIDNMAKYDVVFVGFPTWGMQLPPPMKSFLNQYDLSKKTVIPFNTNAGYGIGSSFETVKQLCPESKVLEGFTTKGGIERDGIMFVMEGEKEKQIQIEVQKWLKKIGLVD